MNERVPPALLHELWDAPPNSTEKYFAPVLTALWTLSVTEQSDRATIDALIGRLGQSGDPDWLQAQITGTLGAVTGQRFAYDIKAWRNWWRNRRPTWNL